MVLMVRVEVPDPVTDGGLKLPEVPAGSAEVLKFTIPLKPLTAVAVTV